jgi:Glycosyl transferases group 1/Glycosyltransferase Family 4
MSQGRPCRVLLVTFGSIAEPRGGMTVRARISVDSLLRLGHDVSVLCVPRSFGHDSEPVDEGSRVRARKYREASGLRELRLFEGQAVYGWSPALSRAIRSMLADRDVLILETALLFGAAAAAAPRCAVVWDTNECETLHYRRLPRTPANALRGVVWRYLESWGARFADVAVAVSEEEGAWWRRLYPAMRDRVDVVVHRPLVSARVTPWRPPQAAKDDAVLVFVGHTGAKHNAAAADWLLREAAPRLDARHHLVLVGAGTNRLAAPRPGTRARVWCLGAVADVDSVIAGSDLCLAPLAAGAGVKTKVLHYIALGRPVLGTTPAFEGMGAPPGTRSVPLSGFVDAIPRALAELRGAPVAARQHDWFDTNYGLSLIDGQWDSVLGHALAFRHRRAGRIILGRRPEAEVAASGAAAGEPSRSRSAPRFRAQP